MKKEYEVIDVMKPKLYKDVFPYEKFPQNRWNKLNMPIDLPENIWITDTTFRDGQQSMESFTVEQIVQIFKFLNKIDNGNGIIRQSEFFLYSDRDREAVEKCQQLGFEFPEITGWIRAKEDDLKIAKSMGIKETGILMSCSDYHIFYKLGMDRTSVYNMYVNIIEKALEFGIKPRCHLEDLTRADIFDFVIPLIKKINELGKKAGVDIKFRLCDTLGLGKPFNGMELPRSVPGLIYYIKNNCELKASQLEWHGHNDYHYCTANSTASWLYGASSVNTTLLGVGERTGNCPTESMLVEYCQFKEPKNKIQLDIMNEVVDFFEKEFDYKIHSKTPFLGEEFNATRAGIHADGLMKNEEVYNSFNSNKILNKPIKIVVNQYSGNAGISGWINLKYGLKGDDKISKNNSAVKLIKKEIDKEYEKGRSTAISDKEMESLTKQYFEEIDKLTKAN